jgi:hypothetical protein
VDATTSLKYPILLKFLDSIPTKQQLKAAVHDHGPLKPSALRPKRSIRIERTYITLKRSTAMTSTIRQKLSLLFAVILLGILSISYFAMTEVTKLNASIDELGHVSVPSVRSMTLIDMYHDGIRSIVLDTALTVKEGKNTPEASSKLKEDLAAMSGDMKNELKALEALNLAADDLKVIADG